MKSGKHATCDSFVMESEEKLHCDDRGERERERLSAWGVISGLRWGTKRHSRPKKAGRQSKRNSSPPRFTLSITNCLRDWKQLYSSTWMMHLSSALSQTATGLNQRPSVCFFIYLFILLVGQHVAICTACFRQNIVMYSVVKWIPLQHLWGCASGSTMGSGWTWSQFLSMLLGVFSPRCPPPGPKYSILSRTLTLCVGGRAINPITKTAMSTGEARARQHNSDQQWPCQQSLSALNMTLWTAMPVCQSVSWSVSCFVPDWDNSFLGIIFISFTDIHAPTQDKFS